jgi:hypothetical protein
MKRARLPLVHYGNSCVEFSAATGLLISPLLRGIAARGTS